MPNKYEREIEEILRNMERTEPKPGLGQKLGGRIRRNLIRVQMCVNVLIYLYILASRSGVL